MWEGCSSSGELGTLHGTWPFSHSSALNKLNVTEKLDVFFVSDSLIWSHAMSCWCSGILPCIQRTVRMLLCPCLYHQSTGPFSGQNILVQWAREKATEQFPPPVYRPEPTNVWSFGPLPKHMWILLFSLLSLVSLILFFLRQKFHVTQASLKLTGQLKMTLNYFLLFVFYLFISRRISLCCPGWPETSYGDQADLRTHRDLPTSASHELEWKICMAVGCSPQLHAQ